jgi:glycosyltransferase involved in cell wall biosynthesis
VYVLPSLEEGMARSAAEAMACGLPVVTTPNAGTNDLIVEGESGSVVAIRDPQALADAILFWWDKIQTGQYNAQEPSIDSHALGFETFSKRFLSHLANIGYELADEG